MRNAKACPLGSIFLLVDPTCLTQPFRASRSPEEGSFYGLHKYQDVDVEEKSSESAQAKASNSSRNTSE